MQCDCVSRVNAELQAHNGRLCTLMSIGPAAERAFDGSPCLMVEKIVSKGSRPPIVAVTFCPFCGVKADPA